MNTSEKIDHFMKKGILISPDLVDEVDESLADEFSTDKELIVLDEKTIQEHKEREKRKVDKGEKVKILYNYDKESDKREYKHFVQYFNNRYEAMEKMLRSRSELNRLTSIQRVLQKEERERVSIIGMVSSKRETRNDNIMLELEDPTGTIKVLVSNNKKEIYEEAKDIVLDEVIGVTGATGRRIIFADSVVWPDVPLGREIKKSPNEEYAVFISDVEVGSVNFLKDEWERFIAWLNGRVGGPDQKEVASKVKYLFVVGDLVAGVGVYPGQEEELNIPDIKEQYAEFAKYIKQVPDHVHVIMCAGNHDAGRITEPQPPLYKDFAESIYELPNVTFVSNPSMVNIGATENFSGLDVLLYHGYSLPYFADNVPSIRDAGGQKRSDLIMKFYLKRRHLAPTHTSNMYIPETDHDPMLISQVPDILATGHIHRTSVGQYRGVTLLNCSAWTGATDYQLKRGLVPQPGRALLVNMKSRKVKVMKFLKGDQE